MNIQVLEDRRDELEDQLHKALDAAVNADPTILQDLGKFQAVGSEIRKELGYVGRTIRLNRVPQFRDISNHGDRMTLADFVECVKAGSFIDYDGFGHYVRDGRESNIEIYPSDVKHDAVRPDFNEIIWYNR